MEQLIDFMKVQVIITLKKNVLDPQGKVIQQTLDGMGFNNISDVRQGKFFEIEIIPIITAKIPIPVTILNSPKCNWLVRPNIAAPKIQISDVSTILWFWVSSPGI